MPVHVKEPQRVRLGSRVVAAQHHDQLADGSQPGELAADRLAPWRPVQAHHRPSAADGDPGGTPTPGVISSAAAGSSGRDSWVSIPAIIHPCRSR